MKTLIFLLLITSSAFSQKYWNSQTLQDGDTVKSYSLNGKYRYVYCDLYGGSTDSVKAFNVTPNGDTVQVGLRDIITYTDYPVGYSLSTKKSYLILDAYLNKLLLILCNASYSTSRSVTAGVRGIEE